MSLGAFSDHKIVLQIKTTRFSNQAHSNKLSISLSVPFFEPPNSRANDGSGLLGNSIRYEIGMRQHVIKIFFLFKKSLKIIQHEMYLFDKVLSHKPLECTMQTAGVYALEFRRIQKLRKFF